ncbi:MAG TPA: LysM peptidoglycan-binding domain-containing protein, partial [Gammaproteobacteria bacterium]|nr:LysM peptidoglycan-binding domain-containing protein [Gammaproteobacteria bacterium]
MLARSNFNLQISWFPVITTLLLATLAQGCGTLVHHKVEKGDTLYSIGFYYGQDYRDIAQWNGISAPYVLYPGQWLRVVPPDGDWRKVRKNEAHKSNKNDGKIIASGNASSAKVKHSQPVRVKRYADSAGPVRTWLWPSRGRLLNASKPLSGRKNGINIIGRLGQPVRAAAAGEVVYSGSGLIGYGKLLIIKHNKTYLSAYAHNKEMLVAEGDIVKQGQQIAQMGFTPDRQVLLHF